MTAIADCSKELQRTVPLSKAVAAAIVDTHEDVGRVQQSFYHWGARGLKKLDRESLRTGLRKVVIAVNKTTRTATLPPDFGGEHFVGVIEGCRKVPLKLNVSLADTKNVEDIPCEDKCEKCNQDKAICQDLTVTEDTVIVNVNGFASQQTIIKKLYPDGSYYLETMIPVWDVTSESVIYTTTKEFIAAIDLKPCGCIEETEENIEKIKCCNPDVYDCYFTTCDAECNGDYGGYKIFEESGLIYFDNPKNFSKIYLEYWGFMPKKNGQYHIPEVAFETLVNWIKFKWVENKRNVPLVERNWVFEQYKRERSNMEKINGRISLAFIIQSIGLTPKFDLDFGVCDINCGDVSLSNFVAASSSYSASASSSSDTGTGGTGSGECCDKKLLTPFQLAKVAGLGGDNPVIDVNYYQNDLLKDAMNLELIVVNNNNETRKALQFTFDSSTGTINRWQYDGVTPNPWSTGDVLVVNFAKLI